MKTFLSKKYYISILIILGVFLFYAKFIYSPVIYEIADRYKDFNKTEVPEGLETLSARECGECHIDIYYEWQQSMHSKAYTDPYYQAYLKKDGSHWTCYYCHTRLERQLEFQIIGFVKNDIRRPILELNEDLDKGLRDEGVTCAVCHVKNGVIYGPYDDSDAPHPMAYDKKFRSVSLCKDCHEVQKSFFMFYKSNPCGTILEFTQSPYKAKGYTCQTCHMPEVDRRVAYSSRELRKSGRHTFFGGSSPEMLTRVLHINLEKRGNKFELTVLNNGAGHKFPTGDPGRYVNIITRFYDADGEILREEVETFKRLILYFPIVIEIFDNRLKPLMERIYSYNDKEILKRAKSATVEIEYHVLSDRAKEKLVKKYGLPEDTKKMFKLKPSRFTF